MTSFLSTHASKLKTKSSSAINLNVNLELDVLNELIGEPLSTTQEHSSIFDIYSILLLNSKMHYNGNFYQLPL